MKKLSCILLLIATLHLGCLTIKAQKPIRIACIGNSITYGYLIHDREHNAYPAQLQAMLGKGYEVLNFGSSGKTALHAGGNPYIATQQYQDALNSKANIIFIKLGTNDSRPYYRKYIDSFYVDYKLLVHTFKTLPNHPRVILLCPVVNFLGKKPDEAYCTDIPKFIIPVIQKVAEEEHCELIDLHPLLINHPEMYPDKLHPDSAGAHIIADRLYRFLLPVKKDSRNHRMTRLSNLLVLGRLQNNGMPMNNKPYGFNYSAVLFHGNAPKYWKRSHNIYCIYQQNHFGNTI